MSQILKIPKAAVSMREGTLVAWLVEDGSSVTEGQPIFTLELEKSTMDVESPATGVLKQKVAAGSTHKVGEVVGEILTDTLTEAAPISEVSGTMRRISQVVADLDKAIEAWASSVGAGPFLRIAGDQLLEKCNHRSVVVRPQVSMAVGQCGETLIELVQLCDQEPSPWRDAGVGSFTPVITVGDFDRAIAADASNGANIFCSGTFKFGGRFYFLSRSGDLRVMVVEQHFVLTQIEEKIRIAHRGWDRRDLAMRLT
jgi:pyruvate/2-oxoglutarate dehydrogenase complex dihydrolipoamide acyltransferase (E2) component